MLFLCVLAWAVPSLLVQVRGPGLPLGSPPPSPEAMRVLWGWPHHLHGGAHNLSSLPISLATRHSGHLCPKSIHWGSPAELCWNYWKSNALFARRVKNSLEKWCWVWNQHNKAEQRDGGRNISEDRVGLSIQLCPKIHFWTFQFHKPIHPPFCFRLFELGILCISGMCYYTHPALTPRKARSCGFVQSFNHSIKM